VCNIAVAFVVHGSSPLLSLRYSIDLRHFFFFFFKQKTAYEIGLGIPAEPLFRSITISTTPVIAGDSFEMDAVGALRLSPLRRGLAIDSTVDIFTFYVPHRHVYGEQWIKFMKDGVNATPLPTVNTTGYID